MAVELAHDLQPRSLRPSLLKTLLGWQGGIWVVEVEEVLDTFSLYLFY